MIWKFIARFLAQPKIVDWLIRRAVKTPFTHIPNADGTSIYMYRYWLFNPYPRASAQKKWQLPVSIRLHHIMEADRDRDPHDHPWDFRTIILRNWYDETVIGSLGVRDKYYRRMPGNTSALNFGQYHKITKVPEGGVWSMFITYKYRGTWGFLVNGEKVKHYDYDKGGM